MPVYAPVTPVHKLQSTSGFLMALLASVALLYYGRAFCITLVINYLAQKLVTRYRMSIG